MILTRTIYNIHAIIRMEYNSANLNRSLILFFVKLVNYDELNEFFVRWSVGHTTYGQTSGCTV